MTVEIWILFCLTETVLCLTPGPAVLTVVSFALTGGPRAGLRASLGILAANAFYFVVSATGIGAMLLASHQLFVVIKWAGAAYLVWLGARMLLARPQPLRSTDEGAPDTARRRRSFVHRSSSPCCVVMSPSAGEPADWPNIPPSTSGCIAPAADC